MLSIGVFSPENLRKYMNFPFYFTSMLEIKKIQIFLLDLLQEETYDFAEEPVIINDHCPSAHILPLAKWLLEFLGIPRIFLGIPRNLFLGIPRNS